MLALNQCEVKFKPNSKNYDLAVLEVEAQRLVFNHVIGKKGEMPILVKALQRSAVIQRALVTRPNVPLFLARAPAPSRRVFTHCQPFS